MEICKGIPESLSALEVDNMRWQSVPITGGPWIKGELVCVVCGR